MAQIHQHQKEKRTMDDDQPIYYFIILLVFVVAIGFAGAVIQKIITAQTWTLREQACVSAGNNPSACKCWVRDKCESGS